MEKLKLDLYLKLYPKPYQKVNCRWIQDLNVSSILSILEEIVGDCLHRTTVEKDFPKEAQKAQTIKEQIPPH